MKVFNFVHQYCTTLLAWITRPGPGHTWLYFTLPESYKTKNLLSKFPRGIPNFRGEFPPPRNPV